MNRTLLIASSGALLATGAGAQNAAKGANTPSTAINLGTPEAQRALQDAASQ